MRVLVIGIAGVLLCGITPAHGGEISHGHVHCALNGLNIGDMSMTLHSASPEAKRLVQSIVDRIGIQNDFLLQEATFKTSTPMAFADIKGGSIRRIVFDREIFDSKNLNFTLAATLGHEIGHHINSDLAAIKRPDHVEELRADFFGGYVVHMLGGTSADATALTKHFSEKGSKSHPPKKQRYEAFLAGWTHGEDMRRKQLERCSVKWIGGAFNKDDQTCRIATSCGARDNPVRIACENDDGDWNWQN